MTNSIAIVLGLVICVLMSIDAFANDWEISLFLAKKSSDMIEYLAFWR